MYTGAARISILMSVVAFTISCSKSELGKRIDWTHDNYKVMSSDAAKDLNKYINLLRSASSQREVPAELDSIRFTLSYAGTKDPHILVIGEFFAWNPANVTGVELKVKGKTIRVDFSETTTFNWPEERKGIIFTFGEVLARDELPINSDKLYQIKKPPPMEAWLIESGGRIGTGEKITIARR